MTPAAARRAATHALTIIDEANRMRDHNRLTTAMQQRETKAFTELAAALDALYGPLPASPWDQVPTSTLCGTPGGYRAHLTHGTFPCRACRLVGDE